MFEMPVLYFTFDDGPHPTFTPAILDVLAEHNALATFFQEGSDVERYPDLTRRAHESGHQIGNHAYSHRRLEDLDDSELELELARTSDLIEGTIGKRPTLLRPPYGSPFHPKPCQHARQDAIRQQASQLGMKTVTWDIQVDDWNKPGVTAMVSRVLDEAADRKVVLLHDAECANQADNLATVDTILRQLGSRGYTFKAMPDTYDGTAVA
jgi:peptidoglycan/xylan/chitin deacetylase (PgdA/CDA1 family)